MSNIPDYQSFESRFYRCRRKEYGRWLSDSTFNVALNLHFNSDVSLNTARQAVGNCFWRVDRKLLGTDFLRLSKERTIGLFAFEHLDSNLHAHGLLKVKPERLDRFCEMFSGADTDIWPRVWPSGSCLLKPAYDPGGFARYITKEQTASSASETMLFLDEFHPSGD